MNIIWILLIDIHIQKIMNRLWRWGYKSVKVMNMIWIMNGMLRRCEKMWINDKELKEIGNKLVIY